MGIRKYLQWEDISIGTHTTMEDKYQENSRQYFITLKGQFNPK